MIAHIKQKLPDAFVIAGNVGTPEAVIDLENWGADATKIGVGPGKVCITRLKTGFGTGGWQLSALKWCARVATKPIIADGGIRHNGDIAKSIRFGATMVMIGSLFAGHEESPGQTVEVDGKLLQGVLRQRVGLQQGRVPPRRRQAHPRADQGPPGRHAARDAGRPAKLDLVRRRPLRDRHPQGRTTSSWAARTRASTCSCERRALPTGRPPVQTAQGRRRCAPASGADPDEQREPGRLASATIRQQSREHAMSDFVDQNRFAPPRAELVEPAQPGAKAPCPLAAAFASSR